jgi:hypothetical protein
MKSKLVSLMFLACAVSGAHAQIPLYGNLQAQEYGDAVYRALGFWSSVGLDYNHTGVFSGVNGSHVPRVMEAKGEALPSSDDTTVEVDLYEFNGPSQTYYGAYTKSDLTVNFTGRKSIVATASALVDAYKSYVIFDALDYYGLSFDGSVAGISYIRCDGVVEYCYEANGYILWWPTANPSHWSIAVYPDDHNDAPTPPTDPSYEFSPFAQRGAPGGTFFGQPGNTYMTRPSVINVPSYQLTQVTNAGYVDVTIQATDESGIHYIGYKKPGDTNWNYSPTQAQHPTSDTYAFGPVRITNSGTLYVFAMDNGGNYPSIATNYSITVPPPDTTKPTVSITNPPSVKTYTNAQTVTVSASASDNIGVASVEFYDGGVLKSSDATPAYTFDWSFTAADNGAHVWTARAYDAAGNASTSSAVTLTVSIDITPTTVVISSPANGANLATSTTTVSGTATDPGSPASGLNLVEVRVNGGAWQTASGTTSWSRSITLTPCENAIEARSLDKAGNYSTNALVSVTYTPPNTVPNTPSNISPFNDTTNVSVTPTLQAGAFNDVDCIGDTHAASQWQVLNGAGSVVVADSGTDSLNKVSWLVPTGKLYYGSNYQWRVRYQDSRSGWSSYSAQTTFTTGGPLLTGSKQGTNMVFKWPTNALGFSLQSVTNLSLVNWSNAMPAPVIVSGQYTVTNSMTNNAQFYRLRK